MASRLNPDAYEAFTGQAPAGDHGNPYKDLRYLVIEDHEATRLTLRLCIQTLGGFTVHQAASHADALHRLKAYAPDVIICDYILGDGRTGQQLLEQLRRSGRLPERTIFIMVTAERAYENVISAVELVPDDYIIKPFAPEILRLRLEKSIRKKKAFLGYFGMRESGHYDEALLELARMLTLPANAIYRYDILRCNAAVLFERDDLERAAAAFRAILAEYPFPWAKAGLARVLMRDQRYDEARAIVEEVIGQVPGFFDAYDLKAAICTHQGAFEEALRTLTDAAQRNPANLVRRKALSIATGRTGDFGAARAIMEGVVESDEYGDHTGAFLDLARLAMDAGELGEARELLAAGASRHIGVVDDEAGLSAECIAAVLDAEHGSERFDRIRASIVKTRHSTVEMAIDMTRAALHFSDLQLANLIAERLLSGPDARQAFTELLAIYRARDLEERFRELQRSIVARRLSKRAAVP